MPEKITLQQAIFGYRDGHNLLAASTFLEPRVRQFLASITDRSGPENTKGFESVFTGLPIPQTDFYAVFCTWPAPEMPRPGCVWTHVILIELADLARIPDLHHLRKFFSRPVIPISIAHYEQSLSFYARPTEEHGTGTPDQRRLHCLVRSLYEYPEKSVVILDQESAPWEDSIFEVWTQQWPRLRREFAFSTGSLGDRRLTGIPFDLQIAPISSERLWRRAGGHTLLLNFLDQTQGPFGETSQQWVGVTEKDLLNKPDPRFRQFLFDYGSDIVKPRAAFGRLATIYQQVAMTPKSSWANLLRSIGESFPMQTEAVRLKRWSVSLSKSLSASEKLDRAWAIVSFLLEADGSAAFPSVGFDFGESAVALWSERPEQTVTLLSRLVQREEGEAARSFAAAIARTIDSTSLRAITEHHSELVSLIIRHNHALAFEIDTWKLSGYVQTQVYETLTQLSLTRVDWEKIIGAMFVAASNVSVREAVGMVGRRAMLGTFRWLENPKAKKILPSHVWRDALALPALQLLTETENLSPAQFALTAWCVPPSDLRQCLTASREDVQKLTAESLETLPPPLRVPTAFLMMALGLGSNCDAGVRLVVASFYLVHAALASEKYSSESWWLLSPLLPDLGWWRNWDRCQKLRSAVNRFLNQHGGSEPLLKLANTPEERAIAHKVVTAEGADEPPPLVN